jgi:DNA-binding transcriptional MocR family regulator
MALDRRGDTLYCSSFSKTIAPGYRIGWIAAGRHMHKVLEHKMALTLCGPALPQAAFADFLSSGGYDSHLRRIRRVLEDNVDQMIRTIDRTFPKGVRVTRPVGGFVLWLELPKHVSSSELHEAALDKGNCIMPGDVFSASRRYANCLRLSCGHRWDPWIENSVKAVGEMVTAAVAHR